ncbi:response regulator [Kocuria palustris]|uniref:response regulator n=1 Tax=Kocuria palustris TaxID=71999 RepID=UPI0011A9AB87|nr:response regulator [Kocuria palustris]
MSAPLRVVVVEDEALTREAHLRFVRQAPGFEAVGRAATAAEALRAVRSLRRDGRPADLLLLDVNLPDATGIDVARHLRAAGEDVDILAVTAHRNAETVRAAASLGVVGYLVKPFSREQLLSRLAAYHRHRTSLRGGQPLDQEAIDRALARLRPLASADSPKGLAPETLERVAQELAMLPWQSAAELAARAGISRVTARRYLEHLTEAGSAERRARRGTVGRPEMEYRAHDG